MPGRSARTARKTWNGKFAGELREGKYGGRRAVSTTEFLGYFTLGEGESIKQHDVRVGGRK